MNYSITRILLLLSSLWTLVVRSQYLRIPNAEKTYGPDGPWNAVWVKVGPSPGQKIDVYPGGGINSAIISNSICKNSDGSDKKTCPAKDVGGGVYAPISSGQEDSTARGSTSLGYNAGDVLGLSGRTVVTKENMTFGEGLMEGVVPDAGINRIDEATHTLPGGAKYDLQVGFLSMGGVDLYKTFSEEKPDSGAAVPLSYLENTKAIGSRSWSMHIGSATLGQNSSVIYGGYDRSRVVSEAAVFDIKDGVDMEVVLQNIGFGLIVGEPPWESKKIPYGNMLTPNSSASTTPPNAEYKLPTQLSAVPPYLYLPQSTCNAIAQHLPIYLASNLGLYLWNTTNPLYETLVNSTAYLEFTFSSSNISSTFPIKVPLKLLALQLTSPFPVDKPTPYFPCRPTTGPKYYLGRSFLQAASIGASWSTQKFWLAQAPGPDAGSSSDIVSIPTDNLSITPATGADWAKSWASALRAHNVERQTTTQSKNTLPIGATVGIVLGIVLAVVGFIGGYILILWKRRNEENVEEKADLERRACHESNEPVKEPRPDSCSGREELPGYQIHSPVELGA
ncbi:hypothetical protein L873DRAFT_1839721 [Choiromyces venosus 120613-1]|uniref:Acid protease n=1 Tax=Choiromyces venosus 120613-1 TaxID=1336337 RepID=A0A3N4KIH6_9PEZI|nr:hypothetical protein L873DRAFT_1839721 [Choiromyces venosus 120613-1]